MTPRIQRLVTEAQPAAAGGPTKEQEAPLARGAARTCPHLPRYLFSWWEWHFSPATFRRARPHVLIRWWRLDTNEELLVAEGFDGVEAGSLPGGIDAEDDADQCAHDERGGNPEKG